MQKVNAQLTWFLNKAIEPHQIPQFRSEINRILGWNDNRFHNHIKGSLQTERRYPTIQFRSLKLPEDARSELGVSHRLGTIWSIGEANKAVKDLLDMIAKTPKYKYLSDGVIQEQELLVGIVDEPIRYKINHWLGLTDERNFKIWKSAMPLHDRIRFWEEILYAQIEEFCREVDFWIPQDSLRLTLFDYQSLGKSIYPNDDGNVINYEAFDIIYEANINLPDYIGMGKGKSKGFGWQTQTTHHQIIDRNRPTLQQNHSRKRKI